MLKMSYFNFVSFLRILVTRNNYEKNHNFELVFKEHLHFHENLYLLNIRGMFLKNIIVKIPPFFYPGRLQSVYDALRKMAHNIKKRAHYCINADGGHFEHLL